MSLPRTFCLSSASAALTPSTSPTSFPNHYDVMKLPPSASTEDVKAQFRTLRAEYFASDAGKYRQLQTAYAVLVDSEARREYDELYRASLGLSPITSESESAGKEGRSSSESTLASLRKSALVKAAVSRLDAQMHSPSAEEQRRRAEEELWIREEEELRRREEEDEEHRRVEEQRQREADPNWGLKHYSPVYAPLIGSQPYHSFVPVAVEYEGGEEKRRSRRPTYVGEMAAMAVP